MHRYPTRSYPHKLIPVQEHVYAQVQGILTSMQAQLHLIDPYARYELNLDLRIYYLLPGNVWAGPDTRC